MRFLNALEYLVLLMLILESPHAIITSKVLGHIRNLVCCPVVHLNTLRKFKQFITAERGQRIGVKPLVSILDVKQDDELAPPTVSPDTLPLSVSNKRLQFYYLQLTIKDVIVTYKAEDSYRRFLQQHLEPGQFKDYLWEEYLHNWAVAGDTLDYCFMQHPTKARRATVPWGCDKDTNLRRFNILLKRVGYI
jgi:hypothetical protein